MNAKALLAVWQHIKDLDDDALKALDILLKLGAPILPAKVQAFGAELEAGLKVFLQLEPLVDKLLALLPTAPPA